MSTERVAQLMSMTGKDHAYSANLLAAAGGDLNSAIQLHFDTTLSDPPSSTPLTSSTNTNTSSSSSTSTTSISSSNNTKRSRSIELDDEGYRAPIPTKKQHRLLDPHMQSNFMMHGYGAPPVNNFRDVRREVTSTSTNGLGTLFKPPRDIMYPGSLDEAKFSGQSEYKWILVDVFNSEEFACHVLNRDIWADHTVKDIVKGCCIFIQINNQSVEGQRFIKLYNVTQYPHVALIDPRTSEQVMVLPRPIADADAVVTDLTKFMGKNDLRTFKGIVTNDTPLKERKGVRIEEEQMKAALAASLLADDVYTFSDDDDDEGGGKKESMDGNHSDASSYGKYMSDNEGEIVDLTNNKKRKDNGKDVSSDKTVSSTVGEAGKMKGSFAAPIKADEIVKTETIKTNVIDPELLQEPPSSDKTKTTKLKLRLVGGKTISRLVYLDLPVAGLFQIIHTLVPGSSTRPFELLILNPKRDLSCTNMKTLAEESLKNTAISMKWIE